MNSHLRRWTLPIFVLLFAGLVLSACSSSSGSKKAVDVTVTLTDFTFESSLTTFEQGVPYHFIVTNKGSVEHELAIMPPATGATDAEENEKAELAVIEEDSLQPGATATLDYTFTQAYPEGTLEFACHVPGHYEAGMHLPIVVK